MVDATVERPARAGSGAMRVELASAVAGGFAALVGLAGFDPWTMASVAAIGVGVALLFEGARIAASLRAPLAADDDESEESAPGMEVIGGVGTIALGVLALAGLAPERSVPFAALVAGSALVLGSVGGARRTATAAIPRVELAGGIAAVALGVAALLGISPQELVLVAMMLGSASLLVSMTDEALRERRRRLGR